MFRSGVQPLLWAFLVRFRHNFQFAIKFGLIIVLAWASIEFCFFKNACSQEKSEIQNGLLQIECRNVKLLECISVIQDKTRYRIFIPAQYQDLNINLLLGGKVLVDVLNSLGAFLDVPNYSVIVDDKQMSAYLISVGKDSKLVNPQMGSVSANQVMSMELMDQQLSLGNVDKSENSADEVKEEDYEVIPPAYPGGKGMTLRELKEKEALEKPVDVMDLEVLPPEKPGEKGKTLRQVLSDEATRELNDAGAPPREVIPPTTEGGKGLTLEELKKKEADDAEKEQGQHLNNNF
ncbi:MAG TPA: hypothetical protein PKC79_06835 [Solidesulfovibrio magneticus]|nr:hypothetical protein [Solidesulfovibrio magneticus]